MSEPTIPEALIPAQQSKLEAEAEAAVALADFHRANAALAAATARKNDAEADAFVQESRLREAQGDVAVITAQVTTREHERSLASDKENNIYRFTGAVTDDSVSKAMDHLSRWSRLNPGEPLELQFYSPGGSVLAGLALWDFLVEIRSKGHRLTTVINGVAASMAGILSQAGDVRVIGKESWLMIHEVSFGAQGKIGEVEDTTEWVQKVQKRVIDIFVRGSGGKITPAKFRALWTRKDAWLSSDEALKLGFVDEIR